MAKKEKSPEAFAARPFTARDEPITLTVPAGEYWWCACGKSSNQPFCDGSHKGSEFVPMPFEAKSDRTLYFCGCKHSAKAPLCDGTHSKIGFQGAERAVREAEGR